MTNQTPSSTLSTTAHHISMAHRIFSTCGMPLGFTLLLCLATMNGALPIEGSPVPITLQTLVVMLAGLCLSWKQAGAAMSMYVMLGAMGLPVFAGGMATSALISPSAGFIFGFIPGAITIALLKGTKPVQRQGWRSAMSLTVRYLAATIIGGIVVVYACGFTVQSAITTMSLLHVVQVNMPFLAVDVVKAVAASLTMSGIMCCTIATRPRQPYVR